MAQKILSLAFFVLALSSSADAAKVGDIIFDDKAESLKKAGMGPAVFPHSKHEAIYKCDDCHPKLFKDKHGANDITMQKNMSGEFCGNLDCHNSQKTFPLYQCKKCHRERQ
ncbi:MAG: hypothetical protein HY265_08290 [Deltaproteobacteria bacterium]|nr:hypothetical protein [Deltaproteobacteria bacterium]MBI3756142.1 hypothetical protein [Deltaproteobacteria bacterium]